MKLGILGSSAGFLGLLYACSQDAGEIQRGKASQGSGATDAGSSSGGSGVGGMGLLVPDGGTCPPSGCVGEDAPALVCGNGIVDPSVMEECDDGNAIATDGCSDACKVELGYQCPFPGLPCEASLCGDGVVAGKEQCDFAGAVAGCDATCLFEAGYACDATGCHQTVCGDAVVEGSERCDDGNSYWGDGCTPDCKYQPDCSGDSCSSACGDGLLLPGGSEECDDGNLENGDGCSAECVFEGGFECQTITQSDSGQLTLPILYRDMIKKVDAGGHPDFQPTVKISRNVTVKLGIAADTLDAEGKPVYAQTPNADNGSSANGFTTNEANFATWYRDSIYDASVLGSVTLTEGSGTFSYDNASFFPLDGIGWNDPPASGGGAHNFYFTSELHYWFQWAGGEVLTFRGDDDVWVFVNKKLVVDLGGIHGAVQGSVTLDDATNVSMNLGLVAGNVYEIVLFQAERCVVASNYRLTLKGFSLGHSECVSVCGDGIATKDELCDEGAENNTGLYGRCGPDCKTRGGYCGDGVLHTEVGEECDDGNRLFGDGCDSVCEIEVIK